MTVFQRFCQDYGLTRRQASLLRLLAGNCEAMGVKVCNGDPYPGVPSADKDACATAWDYDLNAEADKLLTAAKSCGFDGVVFNSLVPELTRDGRTVCIP